MPELADLNLRLEQKRAGRVRLKKLEEVEVPKAAIVYEVSISGLG